MPDSALFARIGQKTAGQYEKEGYSQPAAPDCMGKHMKQGNPRDSQGSKAIKSWKYGFPCRPCKDSCFLYQKQCLSLLHIRFSFDFFLSGMFRK